MIINGDCLDEMKKMEENSIDFIVTDSPYGIYFLSAKWDKQIPSIEYWKEMLRIVKPGSYMACAGLPRMIHRLGCIIEDAGWIIRDMVIHLFGSGFPKSNNFGKNLGVPWNGYGTAIKPAWEGWILAMKPLDGTFAQNAEKWGVAGINIDESRIGTELVEKGHFQRNNISGLGGGYLKGIKPTENKQFSQGRWPANVILSEEAAEQLDEISGITQSRSGGTSYNKESIHLRGKKTKERTGHDDFGGASRFFYCPKASSSERNKGLEKPSTHPTVKPIALMKYLIKLLAPPGNPILLDPFCGSGSTLVAAKELGVRAVGIEKQKDYCEIAEKRIESVEINLFNHKLTA